MQIDDIDSLISKYTDGETTVAEEQQLRNFFAQDPLLLPDELKHSVLCSVGNSKNVANKLQNNRFHRQKQTY